MSTSLVELSLGSRSGPLLPSSEAFALLVRVSTPAGTVSSRRTVTVHITTWLLSPATGPIAQVMRLPACVPPSEMATTCTLAGSVSVTTTPVASWLPVLRSVSVYVNVSPGATDARPSLLASTRLGAASSVSVSVSLLSVGVGSMSSDVALAVLTSWSSPAGTTAATSSTTVIVCVAPTPSEAIVYVN